MVSIICGLVSGATQKQKIIRKRMKEGGNYTSLSEELALYPSILKKTLMEQRVYMVFHVLTFLGLFCSIFCGLFVISIEPNETLDIAMKVSNIQLLIIFGCFVSIFIFGFLAVIVDMHIDNLENRVEMLEHFIEKRNQ